MMRKRAARADTGFRRRTGRAERARRKLNKDYCCRIKPHRDTDGIMLRAMRSFIKKEKSWYGRDALYTINKILNQVRKNGGKTDALTKGMGFGTVGAWNIQ